MTAAAAVAFAFLIPLLLTLQHLPFASSDGGVILTASPKTLTPRNSTVLLNWSGLSPPSSPADVDWIGVYSPPDSPDRYFIGYLFLNASSPTYHASSASAGSISLPLARRPGGYSFRLFRWAASDPVNPKNHDHEGTPLPSHRHRLARSDPVDWAPDSGPAQIHLAFADADDAIRVMFVTGDGADAVVRYGLAPEALNLTVSTAARTYTKKDMCDWPANATAGWRDPGFVHDGVMTGLAAGKRYYYQVGSDTIGWSDIYSFMSRDLDSNETVAFLFGDMGVDTPYRTYHRTQSESRSTMRWILREIQSLGDRTAFVAHIGDISYARGYSWIWDEFFTLIEPVAARVPYHVAIGNHEYDWPLQPWRPDWSYGIYGKDSGGECGVPYSVRFHMPGSDSLSTGTGAPDTRNLYYSFDAGVVHFLFFSTETDFLPSSMQYEFIKADLARINRSRTPFVVVQGHRPMYTTSNEGRDAPLRDRMLEHLEPLFMRYGVTLALWGHVHRYERFCPVRDLKCVTLSSSFTYTGVPVHVVIGMAGQDWQPIWTPWPDHPDMPIFPQPEISMYRGGEFGYAKLVATREKLTLFYVGNHDGQVHDLVEVFSDLARIDVANHEMVPTNASDADLVHTPSGTGGTVVVVEAKLKWWNIAIAGSMMLAAMLLGYTLGVFSHGWRSRRRQPPKWTLVNSQEIEGDDEDDDEQNHEMCEL